MRLINTATLKLHEFYEKDIPPHAILSHRWCDDEVTFKDFVKGTRTESQGYQKVLKFCEFAQWYGEYQWAWIDTVCIDKRSSAELSEAINSMFNWYANADVCYAYLVDVDPAQSLTSEVLLERFMESEWFARGWTLQELLAPGQVIFLANDWSVLCRKAPVEAQSYIHGHRSLEAGQAAQDERWSRQATLQAVKSRTGVPLEALQNPTALRRYSVAQRMSWAAGRHTTRIEDMAYCILGIFNINMPLLYGEGKRAFTRLQHEIIQTSNDESIYAWTKPARPFSRNDACSMLADSPSDFRKAASIVRTPTTFSHPWIITRKGLEMPREGNDTISAYRSVNPDSSSLTRPHITFPLLIGCKESGTGNNCVVWIAQLRCGHWGRIRTDDVGEKWFIESSEGYKVFQYDAKSSIQLHIDECEDMVAYFERTSDLGG